jgi:hypothetical protein
VARLFWKPAHPPLLLGAAGLALAARARHPGPALLALPYLDHYRRAYAGDAGEALRELPRHVLVDAFEVVTMLAGSAKHGTLML